jgi:L-fuculose-phosphate aldolase
MPQSQEIGSQLQKVGKYMMEYGLAWGNAGNISARTGPDRYMITASGTYLGELGDDDLVECCLSGEVVGTGVRRPSKETPMHRAVYEMRPDVNAILHASPFYSTMVACTSLDLPSNWFVETMYYLERVERVPYHHPGSAALGEAVGEKARQANILLLDNHGVLVYDVSIQEARMALHTLEMACRMLLTARMLKMDLNGLPPQTVSDFLDRAGYKARRSWNE